MLNPVDAYTGRRVLLTGGAGYLATNLVQALGATACSVVRLDRPGVVFPPAAFPTVTDLEADVTDGAALAPAVAGADVVFHFAAQTSTYVANEDPRADVRANLLPMLHLLEACRAQPRPPTVVFAGTVTVTGLPARLPVDESHPEAPLTIYDIHKLTCEHYLKHYWRAHGLQATTLRLANVYGPGPRSSRADRGVLNLMVRRALRGETITVYGDGHQVRDYVFVDDVIAAFLAAGAAPDAVAGRSFMIGSGTGHTIATAMELVVERVASLTGRRAPLTRVPPPAGLSPIEARSFVADTTAFTNATGWRARIPLAAGLDRTIETFLAEASTP